MKHQEELDVMGTMATSMSQRMFADAVSKDDPGLMSGVARRLWLQVVCGGKLPFNMHSSRPRIVRAHGRGRGKYTDQACQSKFRGRQTHNSSGKSKGHHPGAQVRIRLRRKCAEHLMWANRRV